MRRRLVCQNHSAAMLPLFEAESEGSGPPLGGCQLAVSPAPLSAPGGERALLAIEWLDLEVSAMGNGWTVLGVP